MDKILKFLSKLSKSQRRTFRQIFLDIESLSLAGYDVKPLQGLKGYFRLRKGKIRIIFIESKGKGLIFDIAFRKDAYKGL